MDTVNENNTVNETEALPLKPAKSNQRLCEVCGKEFKGRAKTCSKECLALLRAKQLADRRQGEIEALCANCSAKKACEACEARYKRLYNSLKETCTKTVADLNAEIANKRDIVLELETKNTNFVSDLFTAKRREDILKNENANLLEAIADWHKKSKFSKILSIIFRGE